MPLDQGERVIGKKSSPVTDPLGLNSLAGGGDKAPAAPAAPGGNSADLVAAQAKANQDAIELSGKLNRINEYGPLGQREYRPNANGDGGYSAYTSLSGGQQDNLNLSTALANEMLGKGRQLASNINVSAMPNADSYTGKEAADAVFNQAKMYLDPMYAQRESALNQQLSDQGLAPGSEGWKIQQGQFGDQRGRDYQSAAFSATQAGTTEAQRRFNNALTQRQEAIQELAGVISGAPNLPQAQYAQPWQTPVLTTDVMRPAEAAMRSQDAALNRSQQASAANKQGMGQVAVAGAGVAAAFI